MKIGFLPLYIELYDRVGVSRRELEAFYETLASAFESNGIEVIRTPLCRLTSEFTEAVHGYEAEKADAIVTWHAAYSPSLESIDVLAATDLPIVVLDTTEAEDFSPAQHPDCVNTCHGIHGVMDMCNLLRRRGKTYAIAAGHYPTSDVLERVIGYLKAAVAARSLAGSRVGTIGSSFPGMGDFLISDADIAARFGVEVVHSDADELRALTAELTEEEIAAEMAADLDGATLLSVIPESTHRDTVKDSLAVRKWLANNDIAAFTANFLDIDPSQGLTSMPFMEASKAMSRGIGYAGEGDILTAALVGALLKGFKETAFVEIFCPDWKNGTLFLSHMGEGNYALFTEKPALKKLDFIYSEADDPIVGYGCYKAGEAVFVNLYADENGYKLLIAPVTMETPTDTDNFTDRVRGWMRPQMSTAAFLEKLSTAGATPHSALVYGATSEQLAFFGRLLDLDVVSL